jgi:hypothetical protein
VSTPPPRCSRAAESARVTNESARQADDAETGSWWTGIADDVMPSASCWYKPATQLPMHRTGSLVSASPGVITQT